MSSSVHTLPVELVRPVLEHVLDRADIRSCALANHVFHAESVAVLYRNIEVGSIIVRYSKDGHAELVHPCTTILQKPWYGKFVRHFSESSDVATIDPMLLIDFLAALRLCTHLRSFTWTFPSDAPPSRTERVLIEYLSVLRRLRVPKLDVHGTPGLSGQVLTRLLYMEDLTSVGVQTRGSDVVRAESMAAALRERLTHLEFAGPDDRSRSCVPLFSRLRGLTSLTLRNATTRDVLEILAVLPALTVLDTHFLPCTEPEPRSAPPECRLQHLTVYVAGQYSLRRLWKWLPQLVPRPGLESLTVRNRCAAESQVVSAPSQWAIAPTFLRRIARTHGATLKDLVFDAMCMTPHDFAFVCESFVVLESLSCQLTEQNMDAVGEAICGAHELRRLSVGCKSLLPQDYTAHCAEQWLRREGSKLVSMTLRNDVFRGGWVYREPSEGRPGSACYEIAYSETEYNLDRQVTCHSM